MHDLDLPTMLSYGRPEGSRHQQRFCRRFIEPVFGPPDGDGNYVMQVGGDPLKIGFMAHHDTVHAQSQRVKVEQCGDYVRLPTNSNASCLGADCTTGVWLILNMIREQIPATYVIHAGEEIGCQGSSRLAPLLGPSLNYAISFDRRGTNSIVTHQLGMRTASDAFAISMAEMLDMPMQPDSTGAYTDSNEYAPWTPECTNISVGYFNQHTRRESQDLVFAETLLKALIDADWTQLVSERDPNEWEPMYPSATSYRGPSNPYITQHEDLYRMVFDHPRAVADVLQSMGFTPQSLKAEIDLYRDDVPFTIA